MFYRALLSCFLLVTCLSLTNTAAGRGPILVTRAVQQTGWSPKILVFGAERELIKGTHILVRPNRPFHFYGNTLRRVYYRNLNRGLPQ